MKWVTPHDKFFIGVNVSPPLRDVTPETTAAEQAPDAFARDTATEVPVGIEQLEPPAQLRHARREATRAIARSDRIVPMLVALGARSKVPRGQASAGARGVAGVETFHRRACLPRRTPTGRTS